MLISSMLPLMEAVPLPFMQGLLSTANGTLGLMLAGAPEALAWSTPSIVTVTPELSRWTTTWCHWPLARLVGSVFASTYEPPPPNSATITPKGPVLMSHQPSDGLPQTERSPIRLCVLLPAYVVWTSKEIVATSVPKAPTD